jgi:hypothetical protein
MKKTPKNKPRPDECEHFVNLWDPEWAFGTHDRAAELVADFRQIGRNVQNRRRYTGYLHITGFLKEEDVMFLKLKYPDLLSDGTSNI